MKSKNISRILFTIYLLFLVWIVVFKTQFSISDLPHYRAINLNPFHDALNHPIRTREVIDNILIFIPYGILISMVKDKKLLITKIFQIFMTSLAFETIQYIFSIGSTDVNDLITNTLGGFIGIIIYCIFKKVFGRKAHKVINTLAIIFLVGAIVLITIIFFANRDIDYIGYLVKIYF